MANQPRDKTERYAAEKNKFASSVGAKAAATLAEFETKTKIHDGTDAIQKFAWNDLILGKMLGKGGFNNVYEVNIPDTSEHGTKSSHMKGPYALKSLKESVMTHRHSFLSGAVDLVYEAKLLSVLNHQNIIKVHGLPQTPVSECYLSGKGGYFIILDRLIGTVDDKIISWRNGLNSQCSSSSSSSSDSAQRTRKSRVCTSSKMGDRLNDIAIPIAEAMKYLHSKNVIYRDLKPSNVGFDQNGTIKLFDFGLAREITDPGKCMTGCTGSRRYMAPEVALNNFYGLPADVYSFGIMLWEIVTLKKPFEDMDREQHLDTVIRAHLRPSVDSSCGSSSLRKLMKNSWDRMPDQRPSFDKVLELLQEDKVEREESESNPPPVKTNWYNLGIAGFLRGAAVSPQTNQRRACAA